MTSNPQRNELQTGTVPARSIAAVATAANSTTLEDLARKKRVNKAIVMVLSALGTVALAFVPVLAAANVVAAGVVGGISALLFIIAVVVAFFTNSLEPAELDALLAKLGGVAAATSRLTPTQAANDNTQTPGDKP